MDLMQQTATFSYCFSQHLAQQIFKYSSEIKAVQKQPSRGVLRERCSENTQQVYRIIPMPKCDFNRRWLVSQTLLKRRSTKSFYYTLRESVHVRSFSGPYFPAFRLNTEAAVQMFLRKRCFGNMPYIYRRKPMPECYFNKVSLQLY